MKPADNKRNGHKNGVGVTKFTAATELEVRRLIVKDASRGLTSDQTAKRINDKYGELLRDGKPISPSCVRTWRLQELKAARERLDHEADVAVAYQVMMVRESLSVISDQVKEGNLGAIDRQIKLLDHEAKLRGLYEPFKISGGSVVQVNIQGVNPNPLDHGFRSSPDLIEGIKPSVALEAGDDERPALG